MRQGFFLQTKQIKFRNFLLDRESPKQAGAGFISNEPSGFLFFLLVGFGRQGRVQKDNSEIDF